MNKRLRLVVLGIMGQSPFAGVAWQVLHYLEGFRRLGCDVYYIEDTGEWPYDPEQNTITDDPRYTVNYLDRLMAWCGLSDRWGYRAATQDGRTFGLSESEVRALFRRADALVNLTGATVLREEHLRVPVRIYLETDPVLPQIDIAKGGLFSVNLLSAHTHHFTYGENFGAADCAVPVERFDYLPTRQPIVLDWWSVADSLSALPQARLGRFTTVANWRQSSKDVEWNGDVYTWSKHHEFLKVVDLPRRTKLPLELALACEDATALHLLTLHGWRIVNALTLSRDIFPYRDYILGSRGEFTVAKDQNVRLRSGWFSDRSACYLAAGRPVVTQETGCSNILPIGRGLFTWAAMQDILAALEAIEADYEENSRAARDIAAEYFAAEKVIGSLMERAGL
jgi:hypothetical protein